MLLRQRVYLAVVLSIVLPSVWGQPMNADAPLPAEEPQEKKEEKKRPQMLRIGALTGLPRPPGFVVEDLRAPDMKAGSQLKQTYKAPFSPFKQPVPLAKYERSIGDEELSAPPVELLTEKLIERYGDRLNGKRLTVHEFSYGLEQVINKPQGMNYTVIPGGGVSLAAAIALSAVGSAAGTAMMQGKGIDLRLRVKIDAELDGRRIEALERPMTLVAEDGPARITRFAIEKFLHLFEEQTAAPAPPAAPEAPAKE